VAPDPRPIHTKTCQAVGRRGCASDQAVSH
jgi:hypothetical protein